MNNEFLKEYIKELRNEYFLKETEIINTSHRQIFRHKENNSFLSLRDILKRKQIIKNSLVQNEINSINELTKDNYIIFHTSTLSPILNIRENINDIDELEEQIKKQYKEFNSYFKNINSINDDKNLKYKNIRTYELTKKLNIHSHKIDFLTNKDDIIKYIESLILSRNKTLIGRIELVLDFEYFKYIEQLFKDKKIKIRVNNKYIFLTISKKIVKENSEEQIIYIINKTKKEKGNFIYFRTIEKQTENDKEHITKYLFKYMLKSFDLSDNNSILKPRQKVSNETLIFSKLKLKQKIYSTNFFTKIITKDYLEKLNNKIFTLFKQKERHIKNVLDTLNENDFKFLQENKNKMFFVISEMFNNKKFVFVESQNNLLKEYKEIKKIVIDNFEHYDDNNKKKFLSLIHSKYKNKVYYNEQEFNEHFFNELNEYQEQKRKSFNFIKSYNDVFDIETNEQEFKENFYSDTETKQDNKLIEKITKKIFKYIVNKYKITNTDDEIYYYNDDYNDLILFHSFKSDYVFEKFSNDIELNFDLLENKEFDNDNERLESYVNLMNLLNEFLETENDILTIDKIKEEYENERITQRKENNERISNIMDDMNEDYKELKGYFYSLNYYQKIEFLQNNDEHLMKILRIYKTP